MVNNLITPHPQLCNSQFFNISSMNHHYSFTKMLLLFLCLFLLHQSARAQDMVVKGKITDSASNAPIAGVSISRQNGGTSTISDAEGRFSLTAAMHENLLFSYVGYRGKTVEVSSGMMNVQIASASALLNDVVVTTALGIRKEAKRLGYSVQEVKGSDLGKSPRIEPCQWPGGQSSGAECGHQPGNVGFSHCFAARFATQLLCSRWHSH